MQFVNNGPEQIKIRESQNTLIVVGSGTVLFSIWSAARMLGLLFLLRNEIAAAVLDLIGPIEGVPESTVFRIFVLLLTLMVAVILGLRIYVGLSAIAEGRGKRRSILYILMAVVMIIGNVCALIISFFTVQLTEHLGVLTGNQSLSTLIIDVTSVIMLIHMVVSALRIRKLTGKKNTAKE